MSDPRYSTQSIERAVYDPDYSAKKVKVVGDITNVPAGANSDTLTMTDASQEVGAKAGSRSVGIQIVSRSSESVFINVGDDAELTHAYISEGEGMFFPTDLSVNVIGSNSSGDIVFWEL